ncbi:MAG: Chromate resistance protein ChrB [Clostridiaceae bacterium]
MGKKKWLIINYNLPTEPSRHRVATWRGLKKSGAVNIQQSMWILPCTEDNLSALEKISRDIESNNGESLLMETAFFNEKHEERIISLFNNMRDEEYKELINESTKYIAEIEKETTMRKLTYAELEEEAELKKLLSWYNRIKSRDMFSSPEGKKAGEILIQIKSIFKWHSEMV